MRDVNPHEYVRFRDGKLLPEPIGDAEQPHTLWRCIACDAVNSMMDGECQFCDCEGADCKRDNCSGPDHPGL